MSERNIDLWRRWIAAFNARDIETSSASVIGASSSTRYSPLGEHTLTFFVYRVRGRQSRAAVTMPATTVATWRDGLVTYIKLYVQRADALRDLGVSEDELEPIAP
jgi:hypothetical protein